MAATEHAQTDDERRLAELGYKQELDRKMGGFANFAISFTIISILSGALTLYGTGINYGGPAQQAWGWPIVSLFVIIVALSMAELASAYPTAGGLYWWASRLGGPSWGWFTGWFNLIGQVAITAGIDYGAATFTTALLNLVFDYNNDNHHIMYVYIAILALHAFLNIRTCRWSRCSTTSPPAGTWSASRSSRSADLRPRPAQQRAIRVHRDDQQLRLQRGRPVLRLPARVPADAVHAHGLRRLRAPLRGDPRRVAGRRQGRRELGARLRDRRLRAVWRSRSRSPTSTRSPTPARSLRSRCSTRR